MLLDYLHKHLNLSEKFSEKFDTLFKHEYVDKWEVIFRPESFSQKIIFIEKGLIRTYYLKDGKDITYLFFSENSFLTPIDCVFYQQACSLWLGSVGKLRNSSCAIQRLRAGFYRDTWNGEVYSSAIS